MHCLCTCNSCRASCHYGPLGRKPLICLSVLVGTTAAVHLSNQGGPVFWRHRVACAGELYSWFWLVHNSVRPDLILWDGEEEECVKQQQRGNPQDQTQTIPKKTGWFVLSILLCLRCFRSGYPFIPIPILCCFNPFTYYESKVFEHQYEISFLPLSVFLYNCWLSKGICTCPCAFCLTLDACTTKWLCSCRHFCVCVQIFRETPPPPPPPPPTDFCVCVQIFRDPPPPPSPPHFISVSTSLLHSPPLVSLEECCSFVVFDCDRPDSLSWCYMFDFWLAYLFCKFFFFLFFFNQKQWL